MGQSSLVDTTIASFTPLLSCDEGRSARDQPKQPPAKKTCVGQSRRTVGTGIRADGQNLHDGRSTQRVRGTSPGRAFDSRVIIWKITGRVGVFGSFFVCLFVSFVFGVASDILQSISVSHLLRISSS